MKPVDSVTKVALDAAWDKEAAKMNLDRWLSVCEREDWGKCPENLALLVRLFGASWYFTRFVFFRGKNVMAFFDQTNTPDLSINNLRNQLQRHNMEGEPEEQLDSLRIAKNEIMLQLLLALLTERLDQEQIELGLSNLAEATLWSAMRIFGTAHIEEEEHIGILGMGRMAGHEMNFGSDLDLIFLYSGESLEKTAVISRQVQKLLRHIALLSPFGTLYEIDMRLRPHGTSGTLISSTPYFIQYHNEDRAVWERQMMTRCRIVIDADSMVQNAIEKITSAIYCKYDQEYLRSEVLQMRKRVQDELGMPRGKFDIKRGIGGIMDIDFMTHYLQLLHGRGSKDLQIPSTRMALRQLEVSGVMSKKKMC